jgi:hypothetical protein
VGSGHGVLVEALAGGRPAAGFTAVIRGHARESVARSGRRDDCRIGLPPGR